MVRRIAVVQNGTELARNTYADVSNWYAQSCRLLSDDGEQFGISEFADESVGFLLGRLDPEEFACVVFASNSLQSGEVGRALARAGTELKRYVAAGGGLVVLHQWAMSLGSVLPEGVEVTLTERVGEQEDLAARADSGLDVLLHYPRAVPPESVRDRGAPSGPPLFYYQALAGASLPESLQPVLSAPDGNVVLARSADHVPERIVLATMPVDWQGRVDLLANAIRFAALGQPRRLIWRRPEETRSERLVRWLSSDGLSSVRLMPAADANLDDVTRWLLGRVEVLVVPSDGLEEAGSRAEVADYLRAGGAVVTADGETRLRSSRVDALVGQYAERKLATTLYAELRAVPDWAVVDFAFELRNIAAALCFLWDGLRPRPDSAIPPAELEALREQILVRLHTPRHRHDVSSSIALAQTLVLVGGADQRTVDATGWLATDPRSAAADIGLQVRAVRAAALGEEDPAFLRDVREMFRDETTPASPPALVRVLDAVAFLSQVGVLQAGTVAAGDAAALATTVCDRLRLVPFDGDIGWMSVEATADVVRGLLALQDLLPADEVEVSAGIAKLVAGASTVFHRATERYERGDARHAAWFARLVHTLVLVERAYPLGLARLATLAWPGEARPDVQAGTTRSLLEHLAARNKHLRDTARRDEAELEGLRLAARIGRAMATTLPVVVILGALVWLLVVVGSSSLVALLANIAVILSALLGLTTLVFTWLDHRNLLAAPAARVRDAIGRLVPVLSDIGKLKR